MKPMGFSGTRPNGTSRTAILDQYKVRIIVQRFTGDNKDELAAAFGVTRSTIHGIVAGRIWAKYTLEDRREMRSKGIQP